MNSTVTKYTGYCLVCGTPNVEEHHLCYGRGHRRLSTDDNLVIPLCRKHHEDIHRNGTAGALSKMLGQLAYERDKCANGLSVEEARESFRGRYSTSYL